MTLIALMYCSIWLRVLSVWLTVLIGIPRSALIAKCVLLAMVVGITKVG